MNPSKIKKTKNDDINPVVFVSEPTKKLINARKKLNIVFEDISSALSLCYNEVEADSIMEDCIVYKYLEFDGTIGELILSTIEDNMCNIDSHKAAAI